MSWKAEQLKPYEYEFLPAVSSFRGDAVAQFVGVLSCRQFAGTLVFLH